MGSLVLTDRSRALAGVQRVFGPGRTSVARWGCSAVWPARGMSATFEYVGPTLPCRRTRISTAVLTGAGWHTERGVRLGDSRAAVLALYPLALQRSTWAYRGPRGLSRVPAHDHVLVLHQSWNEFGLTIPNHTVVAFMRNDRVVGLGLKASSIGDAADAPEPDEFFSR
jgi:hypothetical protein